MGKRQADADSRRFFDEFAHVRVSRFRADGTIDPAKNQAVIPFPNGTSKLISTKHTWFARGGGWSYFVCPKCSDRAVTLYLVDERPLCATCCKKLNIRSTSSYGFGRNARRRAADKRLDALIAKLDTKERLRLKPAPASWHGRAQIVYNGHRLTERMQRRLISLRLHQIAMQQASSRGNDEDTLKGLIPRPEATEIIDLAPIWRANTTETLQQALDKAQTTILAALNSEDPQQRLYAAKLMLNTKQARDRGL